MRQILLASSFALFASSLHAEGLWTCSAYCTQMFSESSASIGWATMTKTSRQVLAQGPSAKEAFETLIKTCDPDGSQKYMLIDTIQFYTTSSTGKPASGPANPVKMTQACLREQ